MKSVMQWALGLLWVLPGIAAAEPPARIHLHSAYRDPHESAAHAYLRYTARLKIHARLEDQPAPAPLGPSVSEAARPLGQLDFSKVPAFPQQAVAAVTTAFERLRDERFLKDADHSGLMRRSTWLYPDDGCFARAALMVQNLQKWNLPRPAKLFAFGNLVVKTPNAPGGQVSWWYHVVPVIRVGQQIVVFDPAIEPKRPLTAQEWFARMAPNAQEMTASVCDTYAYAPASPCFVTDPSHPSDEFALSDQMGYLPMEWERVQNLGRDPQKELGDFPPWLQPAPAQEIFFQ